MKEETQMRNNIILFIFNSILDFVLHVGFGVIIRFCSTSDFTVLLGNLISVSCEILAFVCLFFLVFVDNLLEGKNQICNFLGYKSIIVQVCG